MIVFGGSRVERHNAKKKKNSRKPKTKNKLTNKNNFQTIFGFLVLITCSKTLFFKYSVICFWIFWGVSCFFEQMHSHSLANNEQWSHLIACVNDIALLHLTILPSGGLGHYLKLWQVSCLQKCFLRVLLATCTHVEYIHTYTTLQYSTFPYITLHHPTLPYVTLRYLTLPYVTLH